MKNFLRHCIACITLLVLTISWSGTAAADSSHVPQSPLIISEVQTGGLTGEGAEDGRLEFIELYNVLETPIQLSNFRLEYLSAGHPGTGAATRSLAVLEGTLEPRTFTVIATPGYIASANLSLAATSSTSGLLARSGGHVRITDSAGTTLDLVGWGNATRIGNWWLSPELAAGTSIQRLLPLPGDYALDSAYAAPSTHPTPGSPPDTEPADTTGPSEESPQSSTDCDQLQLSEIVPNPAGTDTGKEFIEIFNPTDQMLSLHGCKLGVGSASYTMPDESLPAHAYRAFYDSQTKLSLPNASPQTVWLTAITGQQSVIYKENMKDGTAWAWIGDQWQLTPLPTPNAANELPVLNSNDEDDHPRQPASTKPSATCEPGKERNPQTNRCRAITTASPALPAACKAGQERNPETNRCRATATTAGSKPCPAGQVRNADTNRCRKTATAGATHNLAAVKDVKSASLGSNYRWWIAAAAVTLVLGYGLYEWRHEIKKWISMRRSSLAPRTLSDNGKAGEVSE